MPSLQWAHLISGHTGAKRSVEKFLECFHTRMTKGELMELMQPIVDACGCHANKQSDARDRGLGPLYLSPIVLTLSCLLISFMASHDLEAMIVVLS